MGLIAIVVNPASGRDIRRLVSSATVFNNREKQNIVERVILAASQMGQHRFLMMPDCYHFSERIRVHLEEDFYAVPEGSIYEPNLPYTNSQKDTRRFSAFAREQNADVLIVLGGDGTSRAAAAESGLLPMISISTGTNNVFPEVIEGTVAGMAAAALASGIVKPGECCEACKRIEVRINGEFRDLALIDVAFSDFEYSGAKAIWSREDISRVVVTQCHPASIGFSAIPGSCLLVSPKDFWGAFAECGEGMPNARVSLAAGTVTPVEILRTGRIGLEEPFTFSMEKNGILALDGEREMTYQAGDMVELSIRRKGPMRVNIRKTLELAQERGFFRL